MVHIPSDHDRDELLSNQQLVRFCLAEGANGLEPTLIVKSSSLALKYLVKRSSFRLLIARPSGKRRLLYALEIPDDPVTPAIIWSVVETEGELESLRRVALGEVCHIALFNEAVVNVCWANVQFAFPLDETSLLFSEIEPSLEGLAQQCVADAADLLDRRHRGTVLRDELAEATTLGDCRWNEVTSHYVTNRLARSILSIISGNEGDQQEQLALWLVDSLLLEGAVKSPQVEENTKMRELSDVLFNYFGGCFIVESKTLSIFDREQLPDRNKLRKNIEKNANKAINQLEGGCRNIKRGNRVVDAAGKQVHVTRNKPVHCVLLIPDLSLLSDSSNINSGRLKKFAQDSGGFLHVLDPGELLGTVQNALLLSEKSERTSPIMAFDFVLIKRFEKALTIPTIDLRFRITLPQ